MPKPYSLDLRERVFRYVNEGHSCRAAATPGVTAQCGECLSMPASGSRNLDSATDVKRHRLTRD